MTNEQKPEAPKTAAGARESAPQRPDGARDTKTPQRAADGHAAAQDAADAATRILGGITEVFAEYGIRSTRRFGSTDQGLREAVDELMTEIIRPELDQLAKRVRMAEELTRVAIQHGRRADADRAEADARLARAQANTATAGARALRATADKGELEAGLQDLWQRWFMNAHDGLTLRQFVEGIGADLRALIDRP